MKFHGVVGYAGEAVESPPGSGKWKKEMVERPYYGEVIRNSRTLQDGEKVNDDISVGNQIRIVADPYARDHFHSMLYIKWAGAYWKVAEVTEERPRLLLRLGGVYNGRRAEPSASVPSPPGHSSGN